MGLQELTDVKKNNINTARYPSLKVAPGSNSQSLVQIQTISGALASRSFKVCLTLEVQRVININFLLTISVYNQVERL